MRGMRAIVGMMMVVLLAGLVAACGGSDPTPTPRPTPTQAPGDSTTPDTPATFQEEWDALIAAAQEEGRLIVSGSGGVGDIAPVYRIWEDLFDVRVTIARGSGRENADRLLAEQSVGRFTVDMVHSGGSTLTQRLMPNDGIAAIEPLLFHPEVIDKSLWYGGRLWFNDPEDAFMLVHSAQVSSGSGMDGIWFNTNLVGADEVATWRSERGVYDLYEGEIISLDPRNSGGGAGVMSTYLNPNRGTDHWEYVFT